MMIKKLAFTLAVLGIAGTAFAQTTFGVKAGPDFSSYTAKNGGAKETSKMMVGLSGGLYANLPIAPEFYIQPSLMYEGKGGKDKAFGTKVRLNYLTLPIDFLFKPEMRNGSGSWIIGVGPYIGYGLSGKTTRGVNDSTSIFIGDPFKKYYASNALLKHWDAGAEIQLGYEMANGFNISLHAELGLMNTFHQGDSDHSLRNTSFSVMVGYTFGKY